MTRSPMDRRTVLAGFAAAGALVATPAFAQRDQSIETYLRDNVRAALAAVSNPNLDARGRQRAFSEQMRRFTDLERIAINVLGRYGQSMAANTTRARRWITVFAAYSTAVYEDQFTQFLPNTFEVTGSRITRANADAIVNSRITRRGGSRPVNVDWRLLRGRDSVWRVMDLRTVFDGSEVWLSESQTTDFIALIERNNRDLDRFIAAVESQTATIQARIAARSR
jgi:ABC-type transporter MlaC component